MKLTVISLCAFLISSQVQAEQYPLLSKKFLDTGNQWCYNLEITGTEDGEQIAVAGSVHLKVLGTEDIAGTPAKQVEFKQTTRGMGAEKDIFYWNISSGNLVEYGSESSGSSREWDRQTFTGNNPTEVLPLFVDANDTDALLGTGSYTGTDSNGDAWLGYCETRISYLQHETQVVPAGSFDCIAVRVTKSWSEQIQHPGGGSEEVNGLQLYDFWISFEHGIVKLVIREIEESADVSLSMELVSLKVSGPVANSISKFMAKAGSEKGRDQVQFAGLLDAASPDLDAAAEIVVSIDSDDMADPLEFPFPINNEAYKNGKYNYARTENASQSCFKLDPVKGRMLFKAKNLDLTGLSCPVVVEVVIGDYSARIELDEDIVNGTRSPCPPQFLMGVRDWMAVDRAQVRLGKKPGTDSISVRGFFTVGDDCDKAANPLTATIGGQTFTVSGDQFETRASTEMCNGAACQEGPLVKANFDFSKCTFQIQVCNAVIEDCGDVKFSMNCFGRDLPQQNIVVPTSSSPRYALERYRCYDKPGRNWTYSASYTIEDSEDATNGSGTTTGTVSVASVPVLIDGYSCLPVNASAGDTTVSSAWYEDYYGTHQFSWGNHNDLISYTANFDALLSIPKLMEIGQTFKDSGTFTGDFNINNPYMDIDVYDFKGRATVTTTLVGFEPVTTVPYGNFPIAARFETTQTLAGSMTVEVDYYGEILRGRLRFQATITQTCWGVEDTRNCQERLRCIYEPKWSRGSDLGQGDRKRFFDRLQPIA